MQMKATLYYRNQLDPHDQKIYDALVQAWMHLEKEIVLDVPHADISKITQAIHWDYPLLFYVNYYRISYCYYQSKWMVKGDYLYTKEATRKMLQDCENWARYIEKHQPKALNRQQMALWLHDVVLYNVTYSGEKGIRAHNMIGVVEDKMAVCEGIAKTYKFLCDLMDIPCIYISGKLEGKPHGWNLIWLGKEPTFIDVTNDTDVHGHVVRNNFLCDAEKIRQKGYEWDYRSLPVCRMSATTIAKDYY